MKLAAGVIMTKLISNDVASEFNFDGRGEKIGFKGMHMWTVVEGKDMTVLQVEHSHPRSTVETGYIGILFLFLIYSYSCREI